ncbi:MAG TPA: hypothetical protein VMT22_02250 [Terriglobales bacterium]|jgi:hypothetical protein|nr:hypothetical protein [Terriglobales bacterium]
MNGAELETKNAPAILLAQVSAAKNDEVGCWRIGWQVKNQAPQPLTMGAVRLPHGQFKAEELRFSPALRLGPGEVAGFQIAVRCQEPPGLVTENAFVIFSVVWLGEDWRIFVRMRVVINAEGAPETATELITTQKVGFSGVAD